MKSYKVLIFVMIFIGTTSILSQTGSDNLGEMVSQAIANDPGIKMLEEQYQIMQLRVPQNSNLPDPNINIGLMNMPVNSFAFNQEPMTVKTFSLSQAFPFPGKLSAINKVNEVKADIITSEITKRKNLIQKEITSLYYDLSYFRKASHITKMNMELLNQVKQVVKTQYIVAKAPQQNILKTELEISKLKDILEEYRLKTKEKQNAINIFLGNDLISPVTSSKLNGFSPFNFSLDTLKLVAIENKPDFSKIKFLEQMSQNKQSLFKYEYYPNFKFSVQYSQRDEIAATGNQLNDLLSINLGMSVPINYGGKKSSKIEEAKIEEKYYNQNYINEVKNISLKLNTLITKLETLQNREKIIKVNLLPQAAQNYSAALSGYQVGKVDFTNIVNAVNTLLNLKLRLYKTRADYNKTLSELQYITGTDNIQYTLKAGEYHENQ